MERLNSSRQRLHHVLWVFACALLAPSVGAVSGGIPSNDCGGCHRGGSGNVSLSAPDEVMPGETVTLTLLIEGPTLKEAGFFIQASSGTFETPTTDDVRLLNATGVLHSKPRVGNGSVSYEIAWTAPATPNGTDFDVYALSSNNNGSSAGDGASYTHLALVYGCEGMVVFKDVDHDGYGNAEYGTATRCAGDSDWSTVDLDCDENDADIYPGAPERCNEKDDNCDDGIDEELESRPLYVDEDGDGFGGELAPDIMGCSVPEGYSAQDGDCHDGDAQVHPDSEEVCNYVDDNCDGKIDEGVREYCGTGLCERKSEFCAVGLCTPGEPTTESCNSVDDNCNGIVDDLAECGYVAPTSSQPPVSTADGTASTATSVVTPESSPSISPSSSQALDPEPDAGTVPTCPSLVGDVCGTAVTPNAPEVTDASAASPSATQAPTPDGASATPPSPAPPGTVEQTAAQSSSACTVLLGGTQPSGGILPWIAAAAWLASRRRHVTK